MFEDVLYPREIIAVMADVMAGRWNGPNPEHVIDTMIMDFMRNRVPDGRAWSARVGTAVKQLGCLDCVFARLNLECLIEPSEGDKIVIKYERKRLLTGENHGIGCQCNLCIKNIKQSDNISDNQPGNLVDKTNLPDGMPNVVPDNRSLEEIYRDAIPTNSYGSDNPYRDCDVDDFYTREQTIHQDAPRPTMSDERKAEILEFMKQAGYDVLTDRAKAYERLEKLLKERSFEQNIVARLSYLIIFSAVVGSDLKKIAPNNFLMSIIPQSTAIRIRR